MSDPKQFRFFLRLRAIWMLHPASEVIILMASPPLPIKVPTWASRMLPSGFLDAKSGTSWLWKSAPNGKTWGPSLLDPHLLHGNPRYKTDEWWISYLHPLQPDWSDLNSASTLRTLVSLPAGVGKDWAIPGSDTSEARQSSSTADALGFPTAPTTTSTTLSSLFLVSKTSLGALIVWNVTCTMYTYPHACTQIQQHIWRLDAFWSIHWRWAAHNFDCRPAIFSLMRRSAVSRSPSTFLMLVRMALNKRRFQDLAAKKKTWTHRIQQGQSSAI